jgi:uncharacterized protein YbjT (DUF2867 family)
LTDTDLLTAFQAALYQIATAGQSYTIAGRTFQRGDLPEIRNTITWLESRIAGAQDNTGIGGGTLTVRFGQGV